MAYKISDDCIACGQCKPECPVDWRIFYTKNRFKNNCR